MSRWTTHWSCRKATASSNCGSSSSTPARQRVPECQPQNPSLPLPLSLSADIASPPTHPLTCMTRHLTSERLKGFFRLSTMRPRSCSQNSNTKNRLPRHQAGRVVSQPLQGNQPSPATMIHDADDDGAHLSAWVPVTTLLSETTLGWQHRWSTLSSRIEVTGTPSLECSNRIFFRATISPVFLSRALSELAGEGGRGREGGRQAQPSWSGPTCMHVCMLCFVSCLSTLDSQTTP